MAFFEHWKNWQKCLVLAQNPLEREIFDLLRDNPRAFSRALHLIPTEEISMLYSAFQSHLWNELLRRLIKTLVSEYKIIKGL
jgi:tRNA pseudouridine13 synthase